MPIDKKVLLNVNQERDQYLKHLYKSKAEEEYFDWGRIGKAPEEATPKSDEGAGGKTDESRYTYVFVYDNLMKGFKENFRLKDAEFLGQASTEGYYRCNIVDNLPIVSVYSYKGSFIVGEAYRLSLKQLKELDDYALIKNFKRSKVKVPEINKTAWMYHLEVPIAGLAPKGMMDGGRHIENYKAWKEAKLNEELEQELI